MNSQKHLHLGMAIAAMGLLSTAPALAADWNGATIGVTFESPSIGSVATPFGNVVVGPSVEASLFGIIDIDLSGTQIIFRNIFSPGVFVNFGSAAFNGFHFSDTLLSDPDLFGVTINGATSLAGFDLSDLTVSANDLYVNFENTVFDGGQQVVLDLQFEGATVPEASTWTAGGALALAVGGLWRRRRQA